MENLRKEERCHICEKLHGCEDFLEHLKKAHGKPDNEMSKEAKKDLERCHSELEHENKEEEEKIVKNNREYFSKLGGKGAKYSGCRKHIGAFRCKICKYVMNTSARAMEDHAKAHLAEKYVKVAATARGRKKRCFRPEHHTFNHSTGKYWWGSDATVQRAIPPNGALVDGEIVCRKCDEFKIEFDTDLSVMTARQQAMAADRMTRHEEKCKG